MARHFIRRPAAVFGLLAALGLAMSVQGQFHRATDPVATPPSSLVDQDDALALDVNPAALGLLPAWSLAYLHSQLDYPGSWLGDGDAFFAASPLWFGLAGGLSIQSIRPGEDARDPKVGRVDRGMVTFGLAYAPSRQLSFGGSARVLKSSNSLIDDLATTDLGAAWRPVGWLGMSLVGRDLLATRSGHGSDELGLWPSALLSASLRPLGTRDLTLDLGVAVDGEKRVGGRAGVSFAVPYVGSASALGEVEHMGDLDAAWRVFGGLNVQWGRAGVAGGVSSVQGSEDNIGWYALLRVEGDQRPGIPAPRSVLNLELDDSSPISMVEVTLALDRAIHDRRVAGVLLRPRSTGMGMADAQELRALIRALRTRGKPVICHLDSASGNEYYACAAANRVLMDPAGSVRLMGTSMSLILIGETIHKIGVRAEFVRIGDYKSAPEQLTQGKFSEPGRRQEQVLLDDVHGRMVADLAADLGVSEKRINEIIDAGPYLAPQAVAERLVRGAADQFALDETVRDAAGDYRVESQLPDAIPRRWGTAPRLGVVVVDGDIIDGKNIDIPFLDLHFSGGYSVAEAIESMAADPSISAIVLRVDSPGGSALASDQIWRAARRARQRKPVIASLGSEAASGGYYAACAADEIWTDPATITGSIGIFYGKVDVAELAKRVGIGVEFFERGRFAGAESIWRPYTPEQRAALAERVRSYYRLFVQRVVQSRLLTAARVDELGQGQVFSGQAALRNGLADREGGLARAIWRARELGDLAPDAEIVVLPERKLKLWDYLLGGSASARSERPEAGAAAGRINPPSELAASFGLAAAIYTSRGVEPLALMPYIIAF